MAKPDGIEQWQNNPIRDRPGTDKPFLCHHRIKRLSHLKQSLLVITVSPWTDGTQVTSRNIKRNVWRVLFTHMVCTFLLYVTPLLCHWCWKDLGIHLCVFGPRGSGLLSSHSSHLKLHFRNWDIFQDGMLRSIPRPQEGGRRREETRRHKIEKWEEPQECPHHFQH